MNTLDAILSRMSCRAYDGAQISEEELEKLLIAANAAPVGMKMFECMALSVIQDRELLGEIEKYEASQMPEETRKEHPLYNAPTCILVSVKKDEGHTAAMHSLSASAIVENILIEAAELGLGSTYIMGAASFLAKNAQLCGAAGVPEGFVPIAMAAVGHSAEPLEKKEPSLEVLATKRV